MVFRTKPRVVPVLDEKQQIMVADLTVAQAAEHFGFSDGEVYRLIERGDRMLMAWIMEREGRLEAEQALRDATARINLAKRYLQ